MIIDVLRLTRWELFKFRRRWVPWVLLAITAAISQLFLWGFFIAYQNDVITTDFSTGMSVNQEDGSSEFFDFSCVEIRDDGKMQPFVASVPEDQRENARRFVESSRETCEEIEEDQDQLRDWSREIFVLPASLSNGLGFIQNIAIFAITILVVASMGVEYGWGTLRTALTRGTGRWQFLAAKALSLALVGVAGLLFLSLALIFSSLLAAWLTLGDGRGSGRLRRVVHRIRNIRQAGLCLAAVRRARPVPLRADLVVRSGRLARHGLHRGGN